MIGKCSDGKRVIRVEKRMKCIGELVVSCLYSLVNKRVGRSWNKRRRVVCKNFFSNILKKWVGMKKEDSIMNLNEMYSKTL
jgi:hypothetical protein